MLAWQSKKNENVKNVVAAAKIKLGPGRRASNTDGDEILRDTYLLHFMWLCLFVCRFFLFLVVVLIIMNKPFLHCFLFFGSDKFDFFRTTPGRAAADARFGLDTASFFIFYF